MIGSLVLLSILDLAVVVDGGVTCPTPEAVSRELVTLLPASGPPREPDLADLSRDGNDLHIDLRRGDGSWIAVRNIGGARPCDELAIAAAVVIASWEAELASTTSDVREVIDLSPPPRPRPRRPPARATLLAMAPASGSVPLPVVTAGAAPARPSRPDLELAVGLGGTLSGGSVATTLSIDATARQADAPFALRLGLSLGTTHRADLDPAPTALEWQRFVLDAGLGYRLTGEATLVDLHTSLEGAILHLAFTDPADLGAGGTDRTVADFGLGTGVRVAFGTPARRRLLPWVGLDLSVWSRGSMSVSDSLTVTVPTVDVALSVGLLGGP